MNHYRTIRVLPLFAALLPLACPTNSSAQWRKLPINVPANAADRVRPWTGMVLWSNHDQRATDAIALEYAYVRYDSIVKKENAYDWTIVDQLLNGIASRSHQAILRFYFVYPGEEVALPKYILKSDYTRIRGKSEGKPTGFVDWSSAAVRNFTMKFYTRFAKRYDGDPRLAYLQTGFGLWAEYHIYSGPRQIGTTFPSKSFQESFLQHMGTTFKQTPWSISVDAADDVYSPLAESKALLGLPFGVFDDSFLCKTHGEENELNWNTLGRQRWKTQPCGGELNYYTDHDQKFALAEKGPHGESFESAAKRFHISYMIGNDQPQYQSLDRIRAASLAIGYRFFIKEFQTDGDSYAVQVTNRGIAPPYHHCYVAVDGIRCHQSLKGLLPGETRTLLVDAMEAVAQTPKLTIESDRLIPSLSIPFEKM